MKEITNVIPNISNSESGTLSDKVLATILINTALSNVIDLANSSIVGITMPSAWTTASITFSVSNDNVNFAPLYKDGAEYELIEASAGRNITLDPLALMPWRYVKIRSGKNGATVNQTAQAILQLWTKAIA